MKDLTRWFPGDIHPARAGVYRAQDHSMRCRCCWIDLHWNGREWHSNLLTGDRFNTFFFPSNLKRWRGLTARAGAEIGKATP